MEPSRRRRLVALWALLTLGLAVRTFADRLLGSAAPAAAAVRPVAVDVNSATIGELMALPGIGRGRAEAIVLHRVRHGPFVAVEELAAVDGIGQDTLAQLRPHAVAAARH